MSDNGTTVFMVCAEYSIAMYYPKDCGSIASHLKDGSRVFEVDLSQIGREVKAVHVEREQGKFEYE